MTAENQNFSMFSGDTKNLIVSVTKEDGSSLDLTGCTVKWEMNELTKTINNGITVSGNKITINLLPTDTSSISGKYHHECEITDQTGNVSTIFTGAVTINKSII